MHATDEESEVNNEIDMNMNVSVGDNEMGTVSSDASEDDKMDVENLR